MGTELGALASSDIERFERDGYVVVRQAFSPADRFHGHRNYRRRPASFASSC